MKIFLITLLLIASTIITNNLRASEHDIVFAQPIITKKLTPKDVCKTIMKALDTLAKKDNNFEKIDRVLTQAQDDLLCLETQLVSVKQELADQQNLITRSFNEKQSKKLLTFQKKQAEIEELIDDLESIIMELMQEGTKR